MEEGLDCTYFALNPCFAQHCLRRECSGGNWDYTGWLTFRRTFASWSHDDGVRDKVVAELMGHSNVYTTLNIYTQVMPDSLRTAVSKVGNKLFADCSQPEEGRV